MNKEEGKQLLDKVYSIILEDTPDVSKANFEERFNNAKEVFKVENNYIYVIVKDNYYKMIITKFNLNTMNDTLNTLTSEKMGFKLITQEEADKELSVEVEKLATPDKKVLDRSNRKLRAEFTFDNYVIGESNRFAFVTAMKIAESPNAVLNPLYIFGDVGLGKTHLMIAIGHYILDRNINTNVVYTSAQQFVEDYFIYTKKNSNNIEEFYNKYRSADVLLVDDIQLLENKPASQEEFFKLFDYLHENNKQIVVTSDRMASELKIMSRLKSRFNWGLAVDIKSPDRQLRLNILKSKLEFLIQNPSDVPTECLEIIADNFTESVRDLEGALRRYVTYCVSMNIPFTRENVYSTLEGIMPKAKTSSNTDDEVIEKIKNIVCSYFQIKNSDLISASRKNNIVYARNLCCYILKNDYKFTLERIGEAFGNKDHTTIMYSCEKIKNDSSAKNDIEYIKNKLKE